MKAECDPLDPESWFEREMWIATDGSLVYHSVRDGTDLVYYNPVDLQRASYKLVPAEESCKPFTFSIHLPESNGIEFAPGNFAANTEEIRARWLREFQNIGELQNAV